VDDQLVRKSGHEVTASGIDAALTLLFNFFFPEPDCHKRLGEPSGEPSVCGNGLKPPVLSPARCRQLPLSGMPGRPWQSTVCLRDLGLIARLA